jgi:hypothetical protein
MYNALMFLLIVSTLVTAMGIAYYAEPDIFLWFFDWLGLTEAERAYFTTAVGGTTVMAWGTRQLRTVVSTDTLKRDALHAKELKLLQDRHVTEMNLLRSDFENQLKISADSQNKVLSATNVVILQNEVLIAERRANALRMLQMSDNLVSPEVKVGYREFLTSTETPIISRISNFYVENKEVIERIASPIIQEKIVKSLRERLLKSGNKEVSNV